LREMFGFCTIEKVTIGVRHRVVFTKYDSINAVVLKPTGTNDATHVEMRTMSIWYPVLKPSIEQGVLLNSQLASGASAKWDFEYSTGHTRSLDKAAGNTNASFNWQVTSASENVTKLFFFMQRRDARTSQQLNAGTFSNYGLTQFNIKLGAFRYPMGDVFRANFTDPTATNYGWTRLYNEYIRCTDKVDKDTGTVVSYTSFKDTYPIFCCDLRQKDANIFSSGNPVQIIIEGELTNLTEDCTLHCVIQSERVLNMDIKNSSVILEVA
jgi:hypothetical protein